MMFVYVVTASASAISAAPMIARSRLFAPPFLASANAGTSASSVAAPTSAPAPAAPVRPRNCRRLLPTCACGSDMTVLLYVCVYRAFLLARRPAPEAAPVSDTRTGTDRITRSADPHAPGMRTSMHRHVRPRSRTRRDERRERGVRVAYNTLRADACASTAIPTPQLAAVAARALGRRVAGTRRQRKPGGVRDRLRPPLQSGACARLSDLRRAGCRRGCDAGGVLGTVARPGALRP